MHSPVEASNGTAWTSFVHCLETRQSLINAPHLMLSIPGDERSSWLVSAGLDAGLPHDDRRVNRKAEYILV